MVYGGTLPPLFNAARADRTSARALLLRTRLYAALSDRICHWWMAVGCERGLCGLADPLSARHRLVNIHHQKPNGRQPRCGSCERKYRFWVPCCS